VQTADPAVLIVAESPVAAAPDVRAPRSPGRIRRWLPIGVPAAVLVVIAFLCFVYPLFGSVPAPVGGSVLDSNLPIGTAGHLLGTNQSGNDVLSRLLYGGRVSLEVAVATQVIGLVVGGLIGMVAGMTRGLAEATVMRVLDVFIAFPSLVLSLAIAETLGASELHVIYALSFYTVPAFARMARAATLRLRERTFVTAAHIIGTPRWRVLLTHLTPNLVPELITFALLQAGVSITLEGALSFLGLGVPPPGASWGNMIAEGQLTLSVRPSLVLLPSAALLVTVAAFNLLGDGLRRRWGSR
jgi:peptide/nickel transport system permease protein